MSYLVIAYPNLKEADIKLIQDYRKVHDELFYTVVSPHFTFVFPVFDFNESDFLDTVRDKIKGAHQIDFTLRCATITKDSFSPYYHTFLVPDEGYSKMVKLHDLLYAGNLMHNLRLDLDFVPHIGIGNSLDKYACKQMVDEWNATDFAIQGTISELTVIRFEQNTVTPIERFSL